MDTYSKRLEYHTVQEQAAFSSLREGFWVLVVAILGSSMAFIDSTAVNTVLPVMQIQLGATITQAQWIIEVYALFLASLILFGGALGDKYGRNRMFIIGLVVFSGASLWCAVSHDTSQLITARAIQGIGGALLVPGSLAIVNVAFDNRSRGRAIGVWSAFTAATTGIGPVLGGWLADNFTWRYIFLINIPISIVVLLIMLIKVPPDKTNGWIRLDVAGAVMVSAGLGFLVFGIIESSNLGFSNPYVVGSLITGFMLLAAFLYYESRIDNPILPLEIFSSRTFSGANVVSFMFWAPWNVVIFFIPFCLIQIHGFTATQLALGFLPAIVSLFITAPLTGMLVNRTGAKAPLVAGILVISVAYFLFTLPGVESTYRSDWLLPIVVMGMGIGITISPMMSAVMGSVDKSYSGLASGINNAVGRVAGLMAVAVFGVIAINIFNFELQQYLSGLDLDVRTRIFLEHERIKLAGAEIPKWVSPEMKETIRGHINSSFIHSFRAVMYLCTVLSATAAVCTYYMVDDRKINMD